MNNYKKFLHVGITSVLIATSGIGLAHAQSFPNQVSQPHVTVTQGAENIFGGAALGAVVSRLFGNSGRTGAWVGAVAGGVKTVYDNYKLSQEAQNAQAVQNNIPQTQYNANPQTQQYQNNNVNAQPTTNNNSGLLKMVAGVNGVDYRANITNLKSGAIEIQTKSIGDMLYALNSLTPGTTVYITPEEYQLLSKQKQHNYSAHIIPQMNIESQYLSVVEQLSKKSDIGIMQTSDGAFVIGTQYQTKNLWKLPNTSTQSVMQEIQIRNANQGVAANQPEQFPVNPINTSNVQTYQGNSAQVKNNIQAQREAANNQYSPNGVNPNGGLATKYGP
jgi:hypothetical protein